MPGFFSLEINCLVFFRDLREHGICMYKCSAFKFTYILNWKGKFTMFERVSPGELNSGLLTPKADILPHELIMLAKKVADIWT